MKRRYFLLWLMAFSAWGASSLPTVGDINRINDLSSPHFSPDGRFVLYTVTSANSDSDKQVSDIWRVEWKSTIKTPLTQTPQHSEWLAQYSPDGKWIAFLSDRGEDETTQIWLLPSDGGEAAPLTDYPGGVSDFQWSPDSRSVALIAADAPIEIAKDRHGNDKPPAPIEITRFQFKEDYNDYLTHHYQHVYRFDVASKTSVALTSGQHNEWWPTWSPDGQRIAFVTKRGDDPDRHMNFDIYAVSRDGKNEQAITHFIGNDNEPYWESRPQWSPDGQRIAYLRSGEDKWIYYAPWQLAIVDIASGKEWLPANIDRCFTHPQWSRDGRSVYALVEQSRVTALSRIDVQSGAVTALTTAPRLDVDFALQGDRIALLTGDDKTPYQIRALEKGRDTLLSDHNEWLADVQLQSADDFSFTAKDGTRIDALLMKPANYIAAKKYPTIVRLHGGPVYQFSHEYNHDWQVYAAHGYAVLAINPRGSSGRGFDFAKAIYADWGNLDASDISDGVDALIKYGIADGEKLGVGGWSYGAILSNYVIAKDARFKAAYSGAGTSNMLSNYGQDQYVREYENELGTPWDNFDAYVRVSFPFLRVQTITTPTLFLCAANDFNVPCNGAEQMYQAFRSRRLDSELVIYPQQHHGLDIPSYLAHRLGRYMAWFDRYLK